MTMPFTAGGGKARSDPRMVLPEADTRDGERETNEAEALTGAGWGWDGTLTTGIVGC